MKNFTFEKLNNIMAEVITNINTNEMIGRTFHPNVKFYDVNHYSFNRLCDFLHFEKIKSNKTISLDVNYLSDSKNL
jgi:hypothetical protein